MHQMEVISLLQSKNRCLKKFLSLSVLFLKSAENHNFSELESFEKKRESYIKAISLCDRRILDLANKIPKVKRSTEFVQKIQSINKEKEQLTHKIIETDDKILFYIENEKQNLIQNLNLSENSKNRLNKFKSSWVNESGEGIDQKL